MQWPFLSPLQVGEKGREQRRLAGTVTSTWMLGGSLSPDSGGAASGPASVCAAVGSQLSVPSFLLE